MQLLLKSSMREWPNFGSIFLYLITGPISIGMLGQWHIIPVMDGVDVKHESMTSELSLLWKQRKPVNIQLTFEVLAKIKRQKTGGIVEESGSRRVSNGRMTTLLLVEQQF
jgi:hypothetical protein